MQVTDRAMMDWITQENELFQTMVYRTPPKKRRDVAVRQGTVADIKSDHCSFVVARNPWFQGYCNQKRLVVVGKLPDDIYDLITQGEPFDLENGPAAWTEVVFVNK